MDFRPLDLNVNQGLGGASDMGIMEMVGDGNTGDLFQTIYPLSKIDIFIIRAYKIITKESILNSTHIQESLNTSGKNGADKSEGRGMIVHPQYATTFNKISKIFNVLLNKGSMGEETASKKSPIELFHRFQQIIKEIELNFDNCSYSKYFNKINDIIFQIRDSRELRDDPHWKSLSDEILSVYNPRTGKMINQSRKKNANGTAKTRKNAKNNSNNNSQTGKSTSNNNNNNNNDVNNNNNNANSFEDDFINMTTDLLNQNDNNVTLSNSQITNGVSNPNDIMSLQRKLITTLGNSNNNNNNNNSITDTRNTNTHGFYTQPTSPSLLANYPFPNLDSNATTGGSNVDTQQNQMLNITLNSTAPSATQISNHRKRRSLGSVNLDGLEDTAMDEILKYTNINKKSKPNDASKSNKPTLTTLLDNTPNSSASTVTTTNASNQSQLNNITSTNNTSVADDIMNKFNVTETLTHARNNMMSQQMAPNMNNQTQTSNNNLETNTLQEIRKSYAKVLDEKDKIIQSLENEVTLQRQESMWLRKLLIEDMGCIRNQLKDITHK